MFEIFQLDFMLRAFLAGIVVALIAPLIGNFLVIRRYSLMADTLAHVSLVGVAVGLLTRTAPVVVAVVLSIIAAIGIERLRTAKPLFGESVLALFLSGSLALAAVLISIAQGFNTNLFSYLFGSVTTVQPNELWLIGGLGIVVLVTVLGLYRQFFAVSYDEDVAQAAGMPARTLNLLMIILAAVTVALSMRVVGVLLIGALMVIPVVTAMLFGRSFRGTIILSIVFALIAVVVGLIAAFYLDLASGGTIVLVALVIFLGRLSWQKTA